MINGLSVCLKVINVTNSMDAKIKRIPPAVTSG